MKSLALGVFAAAALAGAGPAGLWRAFRAAWPAHVLVALTAAGAAVSPSPSFSLPAALLAVTLWVVAAGAARPVAPARWAAVFAGAALLPLALGLLQAAGLDPTGWGPLVRDHFHGRICATLGNPNFLAGFLAAVVPFLWWRAIEEVRPVRRRAALALATLAVIELLLTGSKGGVLGLAAALGATALARRRAGNPGAPRITGRAAALAAAALLAVVVLMPAAVRDRLVPASGLARNESVRFRALTWAQSARMIREAPLAGHGPGRYQVIYPRYRLAEIIRMFGQHSYMTDHPENLSLEIGAELGVTGLGLWLWLLAAAGARLWRRLAAPAMAERGLAAATLGGLAGLFVTNSFGVDIHYGATAAVGAVLVGIAFGAGEGGALAAAGPPRAAGAALGLLLGLAWARVYGSDAALARALAASSAGAWDGALGAYGEATALNPGNVMARYFGAAALLDRGRADDLPEAERRLAGVAREAPDYVLLHYKFWLLYNRLGRRADADAALARQIALDPLAGTFYLERGRRAMEEGKWEDARRDFETAIRVEPDGATGYQYLGNFHVTRGRYRDALAVYHDGLMRQPESVDLRYNAAVAAYKAGMTSVARAYARQVLERDPGHAQARAILARIGP